MYLKAFIPACEGYGFAGGPEFKTRIRALANGRERRNADWSQERNRYTLPFNNISPRDYTGIRNMFQTCQGMLHAFLYRDPLDYEADGEVFGSGDGIRKEFQLIKVSAIDGVIYRREVHALYVPGDFDPTTNSTEADDASIVITVNGTPTAVTLDRDRGTVLFAVAPSIGAVLRWSGEFSTWVRFDTDWLPFSIDNRRAGQFSHNGQVSLLELPPPPEPET